MTGWTYAEALAALDAHVSFEAILAGRVDKPTLDRARRLVGLMGDPQDAYPVIHLTGTNGKGSTARMLTRLLMSQGLTVGTYTSPDLEGVNERLTWNDETISDGALAGVLEAVIRLEELMDDRPSRFEVLTAAAFRWFSDVAVDAAVVEVGLGGRWDATNVAHAQVAVVTNVSLDHAEILGPTLADIAWEKAGIVKEGSVLVLGERDPSLTPIFHQAGAEDVWDRDRDFACERNRVAHGGRLLDVRTRGSCYGDVYMPVHGAHQGENAAVAVAAGEAFFGAPLEAHVVKEALASVRIPGRMEVVSRRPLVILDGAHNPAGAQAAGATLDEEFHAAGAVVVVLGVLRGRDPAEMLAGFGLERIRLVLACSPPSPRALPAGEVASAAAGAGIEAVTAETVPDAVRRAVAAAQPDDVVLVTGSLYVVGTARAMLVSPRP